MKILAEHKCGDMALIYVTDDAGHVGMTLAPWDQRAAAAEKDCAPECLAQLYVRGDALPSKSANGHTMAFSGTSEGLRYAGQTAEDGVVTTTLADARGLTVTHRAVWHEGTQALRVTTAVTNGTAAPIVLDALSSVTLCGLTPFAQGDACGRMHLHRARSVWSAEGRWTDDTLESLLMERSWATCAVRVTKFGQVGSMPVRSWFPFEALEDRGAGVTWAVQLACPSSWQMEAHRLDDGVTLSAGLTDYDAGHWCKTLAPGERFESPEAYVTVGADTPEHVAQRLLTLHRENWAGRDQQLPVVFNEYCTTWGCPSHENMVRLVNAMQGHDVDYVVMDAGWYGREDAGWSECGGDWVPNAALFPQGVKGTADAIHAAGFKAGIWFEAETCAAKAQVFSQTDMLLTRNGYVIDTNNRRFLDLRKPEVQAYLQERVIGLLKDCGFDYVKIDYNDCIGVGCDSPDGLGEGLRQNQQGTLQLFRSIREQIPDIMIENCASGGHRLEPSLMGASWLASFSDAHEQREIPIIAAAEQRLILPGQSLIWAVIRPEDSLRRVNYSMAATLLGVMCLSGDIYNLSDAQWAKVDEGIRFYRAAQYIISGGVSTIVDGALGDSWQHPTGWQAVVRTLGSETLVVLHTFGGELPEQITLPVPGAAKITSVLSSENNAVALADGSLTIAIKANDEAVAVLLK